MPRPLVRPRKLAGALELDPQAVMQLGRPRAMQIRESGAKPFSGKVGLSGVPAADGLVDDGVEKFCRGVGDVLKPGDKCGLNTVLARLLCLAR